MSKQLDGLARGCDLVVGTPGRMLDHLQPRLDVARPRPLRRPRRGRPDARHRLPPGHRAHPASAARSKRQTLLMSATVPDPIKRLVNRYMTDPIHLHMTPEQLTVDKIRQSYLTVDAEKKFDLLTQGDRARAAAAVPHLRASGSAGPTTCTAT